MNIKARRRFETAVDAGTIRHRLRSWSARHGFVCRYDGKSDWEYERGSHFRAAITFDIRNAPAIARIHLTDGSRQWVVLSMHIKSPFVIAKPGDPRRVDEQLDLLEAALKG